MGIGNTLTDTSLTIDARMNKSSKVSKLKQLQNLCSRVDKQTHAGSAMNCTDFGVDYSLCRFSFRAWTDR